MTFSPRPLRSGDSVAVIAPSGHFRADRYQAGLRLLLDRSYRVRELLPPASWRYLAGSDEARLEDLQAAFADPDIRAVVAARGGYGAMRLLPHLDLGRLAASGKILVGFSDITALHLALQREGARSLHGPVVTQLGDQPAPSLERFFGILESAAPPPALPGRTVVEGEAEGRLIGGCLSLLAALVGTPYFPSLAGAILFVEEVGEWPYRLDRLWTQLRLAGVLEGLAGVAIGDLTDCDQEDLPGATVLEELAAQLGVPVIAGLPVGHGDVHMALPLGARAVLRDGALHFLEGLW